MDERPIVLIVEDDPDWREQIKLLLAGDEYRFVEAGSTEVASTYLRRIMPDVAVVDISMRPGDMRNKDGILFLDELDKYHIQDKIHAIMLSGAGGIPDVVKSMDRPTHSVIHYFPKRTIADHADEFSAQIRRAIDLTKIMREERDRSAPYADPLHHAIRYDIIESIAGWLAPETTKLDAIRDLRLLFRNLLTEWLPLAPEMTTSLMENSEQRTAHLLIWSRRLDSALEVVAVQSSQLGFPVEIVAFDTQKSSNRMKMWRTRVFSGVVYELPQMTFDDFLCQIDAR